MKVKISERLDELASLVRELEEASGEIGAVTIFIGVVRGTDGLGRNRRVLKLEYEAHETLASKVIGGMIEKSKAKHGIIDAIVEHRVGEARVGEEVMYVIVASKHRKEGFKALTELVDKIKHEAPIWKKEVTEEGEYWIEDISGTP